jgi:cAMP-dependent protein kinase regulator
MLEPYSPIVNQSKVQEMQRNRVSISAEVFGKYENAMEYKPKVLPKSQENKDKIKNRLSQAFMFMNLDDNEMSVVIDAMDHKIVA